VNPGEQHNALIAKLLSVIPALAVVAVVASSYIARSPDVIAARVYGGPPGPDDTVAWRVVVALHDRGFYAPVPRLPVSIETQFSPPVEGTTDDEGAFEARVPLHSPPDQVELTVRRRDSNTVLLHGLVALHPPSWNASFRRVSPHLSGRRGGSLQVDMFLLRGTIASTFPERALVRVSRGHGPVPGARMVITGDGMTFRPSNTPVTDAEGRATITLLTTFPSPTLEIHATDAEGQTGSFECALPVRTGAMWIDPDRLAQHTIVVASPVGHRHAYLTLFNERARLFAARVPLTRDDAGGATTTMPLPSLPAGSTWIMASPDPQGTGSETDLLAWPIATDVPAEAAHVSTPMLIDGMPAARAAAKQRAHAGRLRALLILSVAALIEAGLIGLRARNARRELEHLIASQIDMDETVSRALMGGSRFWLKMLIATFLIAIAFGALAFVTWLGAA
jgi:hypothetical protein